MSETWLTGVPINGIKVERYDIPTSNYGAYDSGFKDRVTGHWAVTTLQGTINTFASPNRIASSTFVVDANRIVQFIPLEHVPYSDGNGDSNSRTFSFETDGGYYVNNVRKKPDAATHENMAHVMAYIEDAVYGTSTKYKRQSGDSEGFMGTYRHNEVSISGTECCGTLDMDWITDRANQIMDSGIYKPGGQTTTPTTTIPTMDWTEDVTELNETRTLERDSQLYTIDTGTGEGSYPAKSEITVAGSYTQNGVEYYITAFSLTKKIKKGFRAKDFIAKTSNTTWTDDVIALSTNEYRFKVDGQLKEIMTGNTIKGFVKGTEIILDYEYTRDGVTYYMSKWSLDNKKMNGIPASQLEVINDEAERLLIEVEELRLKVSELQEQIASLKASNLASDADIEALQGYANQLEATADTLEANNGALHNTVSDQAIDIAALEEEIAALQNLIENPAVGDEETEQAIQEVTNQTDGNWQPGLGDDHWLLHSQNRAGTLREKMVEFKIEAEQDAAEEVASAAANNTEVPTWSWAQFRLGIAKNNIYNAILSFLGMFAGGEAIQTIAQIPQADEWGTAGGIITSILLIAGQQLKRITEANNN